jgi:murein DD-endopeptidase MepM/ murein hydrolase activator NlpD
MARLSPRRTLPACLVLTLLAGCTSEPVASPVTAPLRPAEAAPTEPPTSAAPAPPTRPPAPTKSPTATKPLPPAQVPTGRYVFPVRSDRASYGRTHSGYPATDIFAPCNAPVLAVTDGVVLEVSRVDRFDPRRNDGVHNGGLSVSIRGHDGVRYYGSHLTRVTAGIEAGVQVRAGQQVGSVGKTGNASNICHLHFGISPPCAGTKDWWIRRGVIWPAAYLDSWRAGTGRSAAPAVTQYRRAKGCPPPPS